MAAFGHAVALGYRYVETDVRATADGALLVFHDESLDRVSDRVGQLRRLTHRQVRRATVGGEPVPSLEDVLGTWPELRVNIDVKHDDAVRPLLNVLHRTNAYERVCVGSFSDRRIRALRRVLPSRTATSLARGEVAALVAASRAPGLDTLVPIDVPCVQVPVHHRGVPVVTEAFLAAAHRQRRQVHVWTVNEPAEMTRLLDLGVDGLVTDATESLAALLTSRGQWDVDR